MNWKHFSIAATSVFFALAVAYAVPSKARGETIGEAAMQNAHRYLYLREKTNRNDAPEIDQFLKYLGLPSRLSWCAAFVIWNHKEAAEATGQKQPLPKHGRVAKLWEIAKNNPVRYTTFTTEQVRLGLIKLQPGDLPIWKSSPVTNGDFNGHIGHTIKQITNKHIRTIEGNTLPEGQAGNQREGGGVYVRNRYLAPGNFTIIGFIRTQ